MRWKILLPFSLIVAVLFGGVWWLQDSRAKAAKLESQILKKITAEEIVSVLKSQESSDPEKTRAVVASPESRKVFLKGLREYLSLASRARREGLADDPNYKLNLENKTRALLAGMYQAKLGAEQKIGKITQDQIDAFWSDQSNEDQFKREFDAVAAIQRTAAEYMESNTGVNLPTSGEALEKTRIGWAKTKITADLAMADGEFMALPVVKLRREILEAGILSTNVMSKHWLANIKASEADIKKYLSEHPEYDLSAKRVLAEKLLQRVRGGEDISKLAKEFSEDRGSRDQGGQYSDFAAGGLWIEIENAARGLKKGEIADRLIESKDGWHVLQLVNTTGTGSDTKLTIKHILIQKRFEDPNSARVVSSAPSPFKTPTEIAKGEVERAKRQTFIDGIIAAEKIELPEDFEFEMTPSASGE
ncbi:MAG: peptidylprolyl isomerase [Chloracidobacterium sp.]|nr:peptidylprolyl isomerase [Chloracidobacterium sp.]